jgi:signal peptidase I
VRQRIAAIVGLLLLGCTCTACTHTERLQLTAHSMEPTLPDGSMIAFHQATASPTRGQVVVLLLSSNQLLVSRVVALPGETVEVRGGVLLVDGRAGLDPHPGEAMRYTAPPIKLQADQYFVLGDNRNDALDSHIFGPVSHSQLRGIVDP